MLVKSKQWMPCEKSQKPFRAGGINFASSSRGDLLRCRCTLLLVRTGTVSLETESCVVFSSKRLSLSRSLDVL